MRRALDCAWHVVSIQKKKKVDIAAAAVYSVIQGAQNFKQWFLMGSRLPLVGRRISQCLETFSHHNWQEDRDTDI